MGWLALWVIGSCACAAMDALGPKGAHEYKSVTSHVSAILITWLIWPISLPFMVYGAVRHRRGGRK